MVIVARSMAASRQVPQLALGADDRREVSPRSRTLGQMVSNDVSGLTGESLSLFLVNIVARMHDVEPTDEAFQLYDYVEPDAIDTLFDHAQTHEDASWRFELDIGQETVVVDSDGYVNLAW